MSLREFNALPAASADEALTACLPVPRWVAAVRDRRPYADWAELQAVAADAARALSDEELAAAISGHPRIGERAGDARHNADASAREQAGVDASDVRLADELAQANAAYEQRYDRVFLIRAAGRSGEQILSELRRRLGNDQATEREETVAQLGEIAQLRLRELVGQPRTLSSHVLDTSTGRPAAGLEIALETVFESGLESGAGHRIGEAVTDADGRVGELGPPYLATGTYRLRFAAGRYFAARGVTGFYPEVVVVFSIDDAEQHYHVPVLLSPFGYTTYRGS